MKATNQCPKCQSYDIIKVKGQQYNQGTGLALNTWSTKMAVLDRFICTDCGFCEYYAQMTDKTKQNFKELLDKQGGGFDDYV